MSAPTPCWTKSGEKRLLAVYIRLLTAHLRGGLKGSGDLRVHVYHHVLLGLDRLIPGRDLMLDPVREDVLEDGVRHVAEPLLGHLMNFLGVRHILKDISVAIFEE